MLHAINKLFSGIVFTHLVDAIYCESRQYKCSLSEAVVRYHSAGGIPTKAFEKIVFPYHTLAEGLKLVKLKRIMELSTR